MKRKIELAMDGKTKITTLIPENADDYEAILDGIETGRIDAGDSRAQPKAEGLVPRLRQVIERLERQRRPRA